MERIVEPGNLLRALQHVQRNGGAPGADGMTVEELGPYLQKHWTRIREELLAGHYQPGPVLYKGIPKPGGGERGLCIPTALDRFVEQAMLQVLQPRYDPTFSVWSKGFRPNCSAQQAVAATQEFVRDGYKIVIDLDLERFFDRVNHDKMLSILRRRIGDPRVLKLIHRYLRAGALKEDAIHERRRGTPQGGPLSPLLANILLDDLDRELERRGLHFVRYADDCNIYVRSHRAGERVKASITRFLEKKLKLQVNEAKSAVDRPWNRKFLGFTITRRGRRRISESSLKRLRQRVKELTARNRGRSLRAIVTELSEYLRGWYSYYGFSEVRSHLRVLDAWIRRRLRCYQWKQWGRRGYRELVKRGVSRKLAWNTSKSAHGPWRLSRSPALSFALPARAFDALGLFRLHR